MLSIVILLTSDVSNFVPINRWEVIKINRNLTFNTTRVRIASLVRWVLRDKWIFERFPLSKTFQLYIKIYVSLTMLASENLICFIGHVKYLVKRNWGMFNKSEPTVRDLSVRTIHSRVAEIRVGSKFRDPGTPSSGFWSLIFGLIYIAACKIHKDRSSGQTFPWDKLVYFIWLFSFIFGRWSNSSNFSRTIFHPMPRVSLIHFNES